MTLTWLCAASARAESSYSDTLLGPLGLNTVPSARMNKAGTITGGISQLDPYINAYLGVQIADPLYINLRQTAKSSGLNTTADRLYPGVDLKLRVLAEGRYHPEISFGLQSALGHKRMAGEYLALSKRYNNFDFTGGLGWGRLGSKGTIDNPLGFLGHFGNNRKLDGEMPNAPSDWFTGSQVGIFGGVEYFTPWKGLSVKLDYGADAYSAERNAFNYDAPPSWGIGLAYRPFDNVNMSIAAQGTEKIMGRVSFRFDPTQWNTQSDKDIISPMRPYRTDLIETDAMEKSARREGIALYDTSIDEKTASGVIDLDPRMSAPQQYGIAAKNMADHAGCNTEEITLSPFIMNLRGPSIKMLRTDFERALVRHDGSADEIWHNTTFEDTSFTPAQKERQGFFAPWRMVETNFLLNSKASLAEEDTGMLYRTSALAETRTPILYGAFTSGAGLRLNMFDNLDKLGKTRPFDPYGARGNVDAFVSHRITMDTAWTGWTHSFTPSLHLSLLGGYLEEMYAGYGGEVLYRPFGPRYAFGAEAWHVFKRNPYTTSSLGLMGTSNFTGFLNAWYDVPGIDTTLKLKAGRFLAGDTGAVLSLEKIFKNGLKLEAFATLSNAADYDQFGGTTHAYNGVRISIPFQRNIGTRRIHTDAKFEAAPFGRDTAQMLNNPMPLYDLTDPFSYRSIEQHWGDVVKE